MLLELYIANLAVVEDVRIRFGPGLNVLSGSTGAGKSLVLGAINLLQGFAGKGTAIRRGEEKALVEAVFSLPSHPSGSLVLRREIARRGRGRCLVDGKPVRLAELSSLARPLIEHHGQGEQFKLRDPNFHIVILDAYAGLQGRVSDHRQACKELACAREELARFEEKLALTREKAELLKHRIEEIDRAGYEIGEKERLQARLSLLANVHTVCSALTAAADLLEQGEPSVLGLLARARREMEKAAPFDKEVGKVLAVVQEAELILRESASSLHGAPERWEFDPMELERVQARLAGIEALERRYCMDLDQILDEKARWGEELAALAGGEERRRRLEEKVEEKAARVAELAAQLGERRRQSAGRLDRAVEKSLAEMGMEGVEFKTEIEMEEDPESPVVVGGKKCRIDERGADRVRFLVRTNRGEKLAGVGEVASTGEVSRIALALKEALAGKGGGGVMVLDELDVGVGADMGEAIAKKLSSLSRNHQILCVTHLAHVAAVAQRHLVVRKGVRGGRTYVDVVPLEGEQRVRELARMLGGGGRGELKVAQELLRRNNSRGCARSSAG